MDEDLIEQLPEVVRPMARAVMQLQPQLTATMCTGSDGDGHVTAVADVYGNLREIRLGAMARRQLDNLTLGDAVRDAVNAATAAAALEYRSALHSVDVFGIPLDVLRADPRAAGRQLARRMKEGR